MSAVDLSGTIALVAVGLLTVNLLFGLLLSVGYNPVRQWPRRRFKLFKFRNWTGYIALTAAALHAAILLFSSSPRFRVMDVLLPFWSPAQPKSNTLGAIALYLVAVVVITSYYRSALGRHRWKTIHYTTYAAAAVFFVHGAIADPALEGRAVDFLDGEKLYVEACAVVVAVVTAWRIHHRRARRRAERMLKQS